jgi:hypothetical protein
MTETTLTAGAKLRARPAEARRHRNLCEIQVWRSFRRFESCRGHRFHRRSGVVFRAAQMVRIPPASHRLAFAVTHFTFPDLLTA